MLLAVCTLLGATTSDGQHAETLRLLRIDLQDSLRPGLLDYTSVEWRPASSNGVQVEAADIPSDRVEDFLKGEAIRGSCLFVKKQTVPGTGKVKMGGSSIGGEGGSQPATCAIYIYEYGRK